MRALSASNCVSTTNCGAALLPRCNCNATGTLSPRKSSSFCACSTTQLNCALEMQSVMPARLVESICHSRYNSRSAAALSALAWASRRANRAHRQQRCSWQRLRAADRDRVRPQAVPPRLLPRRTSAPMRASLLPSRTARGGNTSFAARRTMAVSTSNRFARTHPSSARSQSRLIRRGMPLL